MMVETKGDSLSKIKQLKAIAAKRHILAQELFGTDYDSKTWTRSGARGFITIPCVLSILFRIMDSMTSGKPVSSTYFTLWCHTWDHPMVDIKNEKEFAFESGFSGERAVYTWKDRMRKLKELGFIESISIEHEFRYILIMNPYTVIEQMEKSTVLPKNGYLNAYKLMVAERVRGETSPHEQYDVEKKQAKRKRTV
jgi:hypothetical protein